MLVHLSEGRFNGDQIIAPATLERLHTMNIVEIGEAGPEYTSTGYGLGWHTATYRGEPMLEHGGNHYGLSTHMALLPQHRLGVTVLINQDSSRYPEAVIRSVFDRFLNKTDRDWSAELLAEHRSRLEAKDANPSRQAKERTLGTRPSRPLSAYAGTYWHPGYGTVIVRLDGDRLSVEGAGHKAPLIHWQYDVFASDSPDHLGFWNADGWRTRFSFVTSPQGKISEVQISNAPGVSFERVPD